VAQAQNFGFTFKRFLRCRPSQLFIVLKSKTVLIIPAFVGISLLGVSAIEHGAIRAKLDCNVWLFLLLFWWSSYVTQCMAYKTILGIYLSKDLWYTDIAEKIITSLSRKQYHKTFFDGIPACAGMTALRKWSESISDHSLSSSVTQHSPFPLVYGTQNSI